MTTDSGPPRTDAAAQPSAQAGTPPGEPSDAVPFDAVPSGAEPSGAVLADALPVPAPARRRRGRTSLIVVCAALLGVLAGTGTGYALQARRPPTPLPPLGQPGMNRPAYAYGGPHALGPADDLTKTDGDLSKLLLPMPKGMRVGPSRYGNGTWLGTSDLARTYNRSAEKFGTLLGERYRRTALRLWQSPDISETGEIRLTQFRDDDVLNTPSFLDDEQEAVQLDADQPAPLAIPGTTDGRTYVFPRDDHPGDWAYEVRGLARHGDIVVYVFLNSDHPIERSTAESLVKRQLERL